MHASSKHIEGGARRIKKKSWLVTVNRAAYALENELRQAKAHSLGMASRAEIGRQVWHMASASIKDIKISLTSRVILVAASLAGRPSPPFGFAHDVLVLSS